MLRSIGARALTDNNKKKTQTPLGQQTQKQTGKQGNQGKHYNVNDASQLNNPSHLERPRSASRLHALQFLPDSSDLPRDTSDGSWHYQIMFGAWTK